MDGLEKAVKNLLNSSLNLKKVKKRCDKETVTM